MAPMTCVFISYDALFIQGHSLGHLLVRTVDEMSELETPSYTQQQQQRSQQVRSGYTIGGGGRRGTARTAHKIVSGVLILVPHFEDHDTLRIHQS
jgi:hypothetical protein